MDRPKAYSYVRMSTDLQLKGDSLRRQREASRKYAETHGLELIEDVDLHDIGVSAYKGKNLASGAFGRFLEAVRDGQIEKGSYLLVESFDRLSRQEPVIALKPFIEIVEAGLVLVTLDDERVFRGNISFEDLIVSIAKMSRANEESARKSDRLSQAWRSKRASIGQKKLTARCPSWLRLTADRTGFDVIEERAAIVRRIFDEAASGIGTFTIVRRLNKERVPTFMGKGGWQNSTVNKILSSAAAIGAFQPNRMEGGKRTPDGDPIRNYFPRIVRQSAFEAAQRGRLERKTERDEETGKRGSGGPKGKHFTNLFSKLAVCDYCGEPMHYQNKGQPPKGRSYLVCSNALRNDGCVMTGRWRYDQFEATFLSFVEQLDLASLVSSSEHSSKRNEVAFQLDAAVGKARLLEDEQRKVYEIGLKMAEFDSAFIAERIKKIEIELTETKKLEQHLRQELAILDQAGLTYYSSPDQVAELIERVRAARGGDVYKLRAQIASRLQLLISELRLTVDPDTQRFEVVFRDGQGMTVFVDPEEPAKFMQKVSGKAPHFDVISAEGTTAQLPADEETEDGL
ncbi:recombinase family protein [Bradyrhizobium japonicum]|uniref:recombinase family protein n=1 Tax=Bradyrhizobium japonicum TaxID=375 RepID=UPI001E443270|nr:recombinase family protein [Bradyrhizobium japonicum]MCD9816644.1 recombinase family protein [Bradyrhizobium japonicum]MEB2670305.1 recombinase family protein [Bradyrhizobium japonicum]WRI89656.1 recombinase family protein [Bradyrhizobium japonicum]